MHIGQPSIDGLKVARSLALSQHLLLHCFIAGLGKQINWDVSVPSMRIENTDVTEKGFSTCLRRRALCREWNIMSDAWDVPGSEHTVRV